MKTAAEGAPVPVSSQTTTIIPSRTRGERGTGTTITIDLSEHPALLARIKEAARKDDREPSKWVRRQIILLGSGFFLGDPKATSPENSPKHEPGFLTEE